MNKFKMWFIKNELWLEFGKRLSDGGEDMFWYNEGRWSEFGYFLKHYFKSLNTKNRYFKIRFKRKTIYLR